MKDHNDYHFEYQEESNQDDEQIYQKLGYSIEFVREGFEKESKMYMLRKKL